MLEELNLNSLGLDQIKATKDLLDLDLEELSNEVDGLESLAKQMESLTFTDMIDDGLLLQKKRKRNFRSKAGKRKKKQASKFSQMLQLGSDSSSSSAVARPGSGTSSSVTLCQLMNICDSVPLSANMVEDNTDLMMPFASSLRSELVVEAPDSLTSAAVAHEAVLAASANSSSGGPEKAARMEDISFQAGQPPHREIDWGQGVPVRGNQRGTGDQGR